ncbi:MAG TPA: YceI family protein [Caulobacteraceae bacterium]|jgi:cytochrome b561/polyisoprenoid-binding protein YceI
MAARHSDRYTSVAILMHWLIAAAIVFQILLGWRMGWAPKNSSLAFSLFQLHKSVGITILLLSLARLAWRLFNPPPHVDQPAWEAVAAKIVHVGFYVIMIGLPLTGWMAVSASPTNIPTLLYGVVPWPHLPGLAELATAPKHAWYHNAKFSHEILVKITYALLALHLGAVAKHQLLDRDAVFSHMAAGARPGWFEPRLWLAAAAFVAVIAVGYLYVPSVKPVIAAPRPAPILADVEPAPSASPAASSAAASAAPQAETPPPSPAKAVETPEPPAVWTVRKESALGFTASWSGQPVEGHFDRWSADILFSPTALDKSHLTVSVDLASVSTGDAQRDATLPTEDWFNVAAHPKATFTATKFRKVGDGRFTADGTLDLRGVKKPLSLPFTLKIDGKTARAHGSVTVDRTAFGVGQGEWSATDSIPAAVKVNVALAADRP